MDGALETGLFETDNGQARRAALGLVVLQTDETIEHDGRVILPSDDVRLYVNRIRCADLVTAETLGSMKDDLSAAAGLLPNAVPFDVIGYGCTSASLVIGEERVEACLRARQPSVRTTNPFSALKAACRSMGIRRLALLTPYVAEVSVAMGQNLEDNGVAVTRLISYAQDQDPVVARITPESLLRSILELGANADCDAVFASCTNLRALEIITIAERQIGKPVLASNQVLFWHMMQLAELTDRVEDCGQLFDHQLKI